jgi:hypothetical protein
MTPQCTPSFAVRLLPVPRMWWYLKAGAEMLNEERNRNYRADNMNNICGYALLRNEDFTYSRKLSEFYIKLYMFMFIDCCTYLLVLESTKIYLKFVLKCSYTFRSMTIIRELVL